MTLAAVVLLLLMTSGAARGQVPFVGQLNPFGDREGLRLYSVYAYGAYMSSPFLFNPIAMGGSYTSLPGLDQGPQALTGVGVTLGWQHTGRDFGITAIYSGSYNSFLSGSMYRFQNHSFSFNTNAGRSKERKLSRKWTAHASGNVSAVDSEAWLFTPSLMSQTAEVPATFDEFAAGIIAGRFDNDELASVLTSAPIAESPAQWILFGNRGLSASAQTTLTYAHSSRLTVTWALGANRFQPLPGGASQRYTYLLGPSTSVDGSVGLSYALSPRTQFGVTVDSRRTFSRYEDAYITTGIASLGRIVGRHWFIRAHGGAGTITPVRETYHLPQGVQYTAGGGLGFKTHAHTFLLSYERLIGDAYAFGAGSSSSSTAAWAWRRPRSSWSASSSAGWYQMRGSVYGNLDSWRVNAAIGRALSHEPA